jgi:hypothetical protein
MPICWSGKSSGFALLESGQVENFIAGFGCALDFDVEFQWLRLPDLRNVGAVGDKLLQ